jgi:cell division protein FtsB
MPAPKKKTNPMSARRKTMIGCVLAIVTVVATMFIYVYPIKGYYEQQRQENIERHRLAVLKEANKKIKEERKNLSSDAEIERIAREQYHLIKPGEEAYIVSGQPTVPTTTTAP